MTSTQRISRAASQAAASRHRLVFVVGDAPGAASQALRDAAADNDWPLLNVGLELARALVDIPAPERPLSAPEALKALLPVAGEAPVALDHIEILLDPSLKLRLFDILLDLSRAQTLLVAWPGRHEGSKLTYAEPGWPEYVTFDASSVSLVPIQSKERL